MPVKSRLFFISNPTNLVFNIDSSGASDYIDCRKPLILMLFKGHRSRLDQHRI